MLERVTILLIFISSTHAMYNSKFSCSSRQASCPNNRICVHNECRKIAKPNKNCSNDGHKCPKNYCCWLLSPDQGKCMKKPNLRPREGEYCSRSTDCKYCECDVGLVCTKQYFYPVPLYTCQSNDTVSPSNSPDGDCSDDEQCASDRCCSSSKCKPKPKEGEECFPKGSPQGHLECKGDCIEGTECTRESSRPSRYVCRVTRTSRPALDSCT